MTIEISGGSQNGVVVVDHSSTTVEVISPVQGGQVFEQDTDTTVEIVQPPGREGPEGPQGNPGPQGIDGPVGPQGPIRATYIHDQPSPTDTWYVVHYLHVYPSVTVVDTGGTVVIPSVVYSDLDTIVISFGSPTSGKAYLN